MCKSGRGVVLNLVTPLNLTTPEPKAQARYLQLAAALRADIQGGRLQPGDLVPTEHELVERYGVSRFTVREALRRLAADGLVRRRRGSGTVVAADMPVLRQGFADTASLLQYAASSTFEIQLLGQVALSPALARLLKRPEGEPWHRIQGIRVMDGAPEPVALTDAYFHPRFSPHVGALRSGQEALFSQLARLAGLEIGRVEQEIHAVAASQSEAAHLHIARGAPCLRILRHYFDRQGNLAEMSCSVHPGERFSYTMVIDS